MTHELRVMGRLNSVGLHGIVYAVHKTNLSSSKCNSSLPDECYPEFVFWLGQNEKTRSTLEFKEDSKSDRKIEIL